MYNGFDLHIIVFLFLVFLFLQPLTISQNILVL